MLPVVAAIVLGGFRIQSSLQTQDQLGRVAQLGNVAQAATLLATALQAERDEMAGTVMYTQSADSDEITQDQKTTDTRQTAFTKLVESLDKSTLPADGADITDIETKLNQLNQIRTDAFSNAKTGTEAEPTVQAYENLIQPLLALSQDLALASSNSELVQATRSLQEFSKWKDDQSVVRAVIAAGLATNDRSIKAGHGPTQLSPGDRAFVRSASASADSTKATFEGLYGVTRANNLDGAWLNAINVTRAGLVVKGVVNATDGWGGSSAPPTYNDWNAEATTQITNMNADESILVQQLNSKVLSLRSSAQQDAIINAALIALVLLVAVIGAAIVARSMVRTLGTLQSAAEDVAEHRLPELVRILSESDPQDVDTSVAPIGINTTDEIGSVARAFDQVHAQAVRLAAEQALLRGNINAMFTNLSRRSQGLIQRQLSMISELESREADPDQLASLFKLDHLATRMRRNGENLLVLAGEDPGRRWTRPVPLVDVLRAAASEVEQYERIELASVPTADVAGRVVNDLVHLLAELLENATSFSSPQTRVRVTGHALPDGRVLVEIHDTGIGLSPDDLAEINERLANPPVVDVSVSRRMGLFVVGRLSLRHGIRIQLRPSDSGGTTALVMLPVDVTNAAERRGGAQAPGQQRPQGGPQGGVPGGPQGPQSAMQGSMQQGQGAPPVRGQQQRGAVPQAPGRPSLPPQSPEQPGLPRRGNAPGLPQGSSPMGGQQGGPRRPQAPQPPQPAPQPVQAQEPQRPQAPTAPAAPQPTGPLDERTLWAEQPQHGSPLGRPQPADALGSADSTAQFARPHFDEEPARPIPPRPAPQQPQQFAPQRPQAPQPPQGRPPQQQPMPPQQQFPPQQFPQAPQPQAPQSQTPQSQDLANHPLTRALPPAEAGAGSSPIFEAMESNWFRSGRADRMRAVQVYGQESAQPPQAPQQQAPGRPQPYQPQRPSTSAVPAPSGADRAPFGAPPQRPVPQRGTAEGVPSGATAAGPWRASANDEVWRRAEQVREPSAGGVLPSGLPRRVPQANLVPGMAESTPAEGPQPQVSRSPEEVRGRLTNLRRGIQQGRQAGSDNHNQATPNQANQPNQSGGPYGSNPQER
ncbi:nitrate- and nitrite sensing domain-containing protein [Streptacidiphilus alkalitolerans]|uniref:sensor histidine kinase n=1 Tax=Streptacidiphilus alkalitolerans TaxID=3342712 RepID=UPI0039F1D8A8